MEITLHPMAAIYGTFLSQADVARILEVGEQTAKNYILKSGLPHTKISTQIKVPRRAFIEWMNSQSIGITYIDPGYDPEYVNQDGQ